MLMPELLRRLEEGALQKLSFILSEGRRPPAPPSLQCWAGGCTASALILAPPPKEIRANPTPLGPSPASNAKATDRKSVTRSASHAPRPTPAAGLQPLPSFA